MRLLTTVRNCPPVVFFHKKR
uniref:Uncharacterized protein n=1 Tax=Anguilla anguilla TaxID=7936 RepID=A0A0E9U969_ANGAN